MSWLIFSETENFSPTQDKNEKNFQNENVLTSLNKSAQAICTTFFIVYMLITYIYCL